MKKIGHSIVYAPRKSMTFIIPILTKLIIAVGYYMEIFCAKFHPIWLRNTGIMGINSFRTVN
jgi:hypothetical protein